MKFDELNAEFVGLRNMLRTFVGEEAFDEITIQPPAGDDEASFLRLTAWSYVLIFEAGRVTIPYLLKLPSSMDYAKEDAAHHLIRDLRTWSFHNLGFQNERDIEISKKILLWFIDRCKAYPPTDRKDWRVCFEHLCDEVGAILAQCKNALETALSDAEGQEEIIDDLRRRLTRNWPAHRFDEIVSDAAIRMGQRLNVQKFGRLRLSTWRKFLESVPEGDDPEGQVTRLIERDVLVHFESVLPIDGRDAMNVLELDPGPEVGEALKLAGRLYRSGITNREELLECLAEEYGSGGADTDRNGRDTGPIGS